MDISKAFNRVIHSGLICKLEHSGIDGSLLNLLSYYQGGRSQIVGINESFANACYTNCRVLQGSNLGPLLFLIQYMSTILLNPLNPQSHCSLTTRPYYSLLAVHFIPTRF